MSLHRIPLAGVIGSPIAHSKSPRLHQHWLAKYGIAGDYVPLHVEKDDLRDVLRVLPKMGFVGANVTIPHKVAALEIADQVSDRASLIGAANTLIFHEDGKIIADNTDGYGFLANLKQGAPDWRPDLGPAAVVAGLSICATSMPDANFILHGDEAELTKLLARHPALQAKVTIQHAARVVTMDDKPSQVMRHGQGTSMWGCIDSVRAGEATVAVSCGNTGALMAIAMVLVWRSTRVINFAQAGMALLSTYIGFELVQKTGNFWIALPLAMILGALFSALVEILLIRTLIKHSTTGPVAGIVPIIATLGLLGVIRASIGIIWGNQDIQIQPPLSKVGFKVGEETIALSPMNLLVLLTVVGMVILLGFIFQKTNLGLSLRASAYSPEIAQLAGIRVGAIRTIGWAIAGAAGAAAGLLQTVNGTGAVSPDSLEFSLLLTFGFIAAVIGGLESLPGAVLGALVLGLVLAAVQIYISGTLVFMIAFALLLLVLLVRPQGFIGAKAGRRA